MSCTGRLVSVCRRIARRLLARRRLAVMEVRNKLRGSRRAHALKRLEDAEVNRLALQLSPVVQAQVATIIATYRRPDLLVRAVHSALAQTVRDHVVIVVDDGGGLPPLPDDPRLKTCSLSVNTAVAGVVRNIGIRLTRSAYVAFLDDDNEWTPDHLEVALAALENGPAELRPGLVYTALVRGLPDGQIRDVLSTQFDRRLLARDNYVDTNALVIRRFDGLHFSRLKRPREMSPGEDWELAYRLSRHLRVLHVPIPTVRYLINPDSHWTSWGPSTSAASVASSAASRPDDVLRREGADP
jgi:hypothetical protein